MMIFYDLWAVTVYWNVELRSYKPGKIKAQNVKNNLDGDKYYAIYLCRPQPGQEQEFAGAQEGAPVLLLASICQPLHYLQGYEVTPGPRHTFTH